jgi:hypothetical protein
VQRGDIGCGARGFVRCQSVVEYAIIFVIAVAALTAVLVGHEWTRIALARGGGVGRRAAAVVASMVVTYVLACVPAFIVLAVRGTPGQRHYAVGETLDGYDAAGKLQRGDVIVAVDGNAVSPTTTPSLVERVEEAKGAPVTLTIRRDGGTANVAIQPKAEGARWLLGIRMAIDVEHDTNIGSAAGSAIAFPIDRAQQEARLLSDLITDRIDAGGPTRMVEEFARAQVVEPGWVRGLTGAASACFFALLVLVAIDLGRLVRCALSARRASR